VRLPPASTPLIYFEKKHRQRNAKHRFIRFASPPSSFSSSLIIAPHHFAYRSASRDRRVYRGLRGQQKPSLAQVARQQNVAIAMRACRSMLYVCAIISAY